MLAVIHGNDVDLIDAMRRGDADAQQKFKAKYEALLFEICRMFTPNEKSAASALKDLLLSPNFPDFFAGYDGRASVQTFASKVLKDGFLFERLRAIIRRDKEIGIEEFAAFFRRDIARKVKRRIANPELHEDAVNWVLEQVIKNDRGQLAVWAEQADSPAFVITKLEYLAQDFRNSGDAPVEGRKRQLPECVKRMEKLEQAVFRQIYFHHVSSTQLIVLALARDFAGVDAQKVIEAKVKVEATLSQNGYSQSDVFEPATDSIDERVDIASGMAAETDPNFAMDMAEEERQRAAFRQALLAAARELAPREQLYLLKQLEGKPSRTIARELNIRVEEVYQLTRIVQGKLRKKLLSSEAAKNLMATVSGNDKYIDAAPSGKVG